MLTQMRKSAQSNPILLLILLIIVALVFAFAVAPATADASTPNYNCPSFNYDCPYDGCCIPCGECEVCDPEAHVPVPPPPPPPPTEVAAACDTCNRNPCACCGDCGYSPCECGAVTEAPAAAATPRDPNAGPRTGDDLNNNWFVQIAGISLLVAALAIAGLISTGRKGRLDKNKVYRLSI